jgi:hypothetical protein
MRKAACSRCSHMRHMYRWHESAHDAWVGPMYTIRRAWEQEMWTGVFLASFSTGGNRY